MAEASSAVATGPITLRCGPSACSVYPEVGGSLGSWRIGGQELLRVATAEAIATRNPYGMSSFPLVPYSNRIGGAAFSWAGEDFRLTKNFLPESHAIHGVGFLRAWEATATTADSTLLTLHHEPDRHWPWAFRARQRITVTDDELLLELAATNLASRAAPLAFGHHPYFPRHGARLSFAAERVWLPGDDGLPSTAVVPSGPFDFSIARSIDALDIDHCFAGWQRSARIAWVDQPWAIDISASASLPAAVVYVPREGEFFCFEPVPHIINALNLSGHEPTMPIVNAGAAFEASIRFRSVKPPR